MTPRVESTNPSFQAIFIWDPFAVKSTNEDDDVQGHDADKAGKFWVIIRGIAQVTISQKQPNSHENDKTWNP